MYCFLWLPFDVTPAVNGVLTTRSLQPWQLRDSWGLSPQHVQGDAAAAVADDLCVADVEAQEALRDEAAVHARQHRQLQGGEHTKS